MSDISRPRLRLRDFPMVFLSYDEPWADAHWRDLLSSQPRAARVHGVKGLDACHKAAADAVNGDWVITIDADTRIDAALLDAPVPSALLNGDFRLDWLSRNAVNGLWSGNGCVKLWPKALLREMRTHEAAEGDAPSLDHDVAGIRPLRSAKVTMPERAALTEPSQSPFHAFRAGLRETAFLRALAVASTASAEPVGWSAEAASRRLLSIWCSIGRHAPNGHWQIYGARLGLALPDLRPGWDPRTINDYDWIAELWSTHVMPRYLRGSTAAPSWGWERLDSDLRLIGAGLAETSGLVLAEIGSEASRLMAHVDQLSPLAPPSKIDSVGYRLQCASRSAQADAVARGFLEIAAALDHPAAFDNLGRLHTNGRMIGADPARAAWLFRAAEALGNPYAAAHHAELASTSAGLGVTPPAYLAKDFPVIRAEKDGIATLRRALDDCTAPICLVLDPGVSIAPAAASHVPDPALLVDGRILGYLSRCAVTGLPQPRGVRMAAPQSLRDTLDKQPDATIPVVLGLLPAPASAAEAIRGGLGTGEAPIAPLLACLGRDVPFGDHWVLGTLLALAGNRPDDAELQRLAGMDGWELAPLLLAAASACERRFGQSVPVWTAEESSALKTMISPFPGKSHWTSAAQRLVELGSGSLAYGETMAAVALAIWGRYPPGALPSEEASS